MKMEGIHGLLRPGDAVTVSGNILTGKISGETLIGKISGEIVKDTTPTVIRTDYTVIGALSGGVELSSGTINWVSVKAVRNNSGDIFVGASGTVYSGHGFPLMSGETLNFNVDNLNRVYAMAVVSGDQLAYFGTDY